MWPLSCVWNVSQNWNLIWKTFLWTNTCNWYCKNFCCFTIIKNLDIYIFQVLTFFFNVSLHSHTHTPKKIHCNDIIQWVISQTYIELIYFFLTDAPEIKSVVINEYRRNPYNDSFPITVTSIIRTYPNATITWGISHEKSLSSFLPLGMTILLTGMAKFYPDP